MLSDRTFFELEAKETHLCFASIFGNDNPVYIEIGSGKGEFISQYPRLHPEWNFLGFEVRGKRINNILKKLDPKLNANVRIIRQLIDSAITKIIPPESVHGVFVQHPDPWPKKKHHKRRLIQQDFLDALASILISGAQVQVSTDHDEYANWIAEEFCLNPNFLCLHDQPIQSTPSLDIHIVTWFEQEQKRLGFEPNFMLFQKI
ncbi:MAG: tRNA (guanosine(46)-N7)-methyltransferase TrmB [Candidatus Cloacimonadaceae bacterium]|nr:tRNA (guanosine(46)-N7)-methyltransferase TrmB [Candidatus Cloacimonadaceae bacterium]MDP3113891.1 tRNA (guanosine(46)-N7)-methyltransferase TrmB [Candidatus Cloacimonadaceae bacterium]